MGKEWHGGKGDSRRKGSDDKKYRDGWDKIFGNKEKSKEKKND